MLRNDLAANPRRCVLAVWHHPLFSSGPHAPTRSTADLWQILEEAGAELIVNGNDHHYERFDPQTFEGVADPEGILATIAGTGGSRPVGFQSPIDNSVVRKSHVFGVLRLELAPRSYAFEFITVAGPEFSDRGAVGMTTPFGPTVMRRNLANVATPMSLGSCDGSSRSESRPCEA